MESAILIILGVIINLAVLIFLFVILKMINRNKTDAEALQNTMKIFGNMISENINEKQEYFNRNISELLKAYESKQEKVSAMHLEQLKSTEKIMSEKQEITKENLIQNLKQFEERLKTFSIETEQKLENMRKAMSERLEDLQKDNNKKLDEMRTVVDQKLSETLNKRMTESFKLVNDRLQEVYKGLGEMQNLAKGVGDLKKVLSNVKTRGVLGEVQLGAILEEILSSEQYDKNVATKKGSKNVVEYAVKLPGENGEFVYLPIDSKFPGDTYGYLRDAYESGNSEEIQKNVKALIDTIKKEAKDIRDKYIDVPNTTDFAIMFLPFEGLYSEIVNRGLIEILQREYHVNVAGPSTMAALLNSLQMGFRTFAIQKRSSEVWNILGAVKTEFDKFSEVLSRTLERLNQASGELDKLVGVRTRQIQRKLKDVTRLEEVQSQNVLELAEPVDVKEDNI